MTDDRLEDQAHDFISRFAAAPPSERASMADEGSVLKSLLTGLAMDLGHNKATEFSPRIKDCQLLAAKVALLIHWPDEEALTYAERAVFYYRSQESARWLVDDYVAFREAWVDAGVVRLDQ